MPETPPTAPLGKADWLYDRGDPGVDPTAGMHIPCCSMPLPGRFRPCHNGPLTGEQIETGDCGEHTQ